MIRVFFFILAFFCVVKKISGKSIIFFHVFLFFFENFKNLIPTRKNKIKILQGTKCTWGKN